MAASGRPGKHLNQEERSERSRRQILDAALKLFSTRGFGATSMRDIAQKAGVSTGSVYHQFPDKETVFRELLDEYWRAIASPDFPFNKALASGAFPDDLEALGEAARESVRLYRSHVALIYVDVVEFEGSHIRSTSNISCWRSLRARRTARLWLTWSNSPFSSTKSPWITSGTIWNGDKVPGSLLVRSNTLENGFSSGSSHSFASGPDGSKMMVSMPQRTALWASEPIRTDLPAPSSATIGNSPERFSTSGP